MTDESGWVFTGRWITSGEFSGLSPFNVFHRELQPPVNQKGPLENKHILFRKKFFLEQGAVPGVPAYIHISADDYYKLWINGSFVTQGPSPAYPFSYYYNTVDVSAFLHPGENVLAVHSYYQGLINRVWVSGDNRHGLILDLELGGKIIVQSDASFLCREHSGFAVMGKTGYATQFTEQYDSSSLEAGFERPRFDDSRWGRAVINENDDHRLVPQPSAQLVFEKIPPLSIIKTPAGYIADFGSIYVGYVCLSANGKRGQKIVIRQGQELLENGSVRFEMRANCKYEEAWILSGGEDSLDQFDYKAFRYVELILPDGNCKITPESFFVSVRHYPFALKTPCNSLDPQLQAVFKLCVNSLRYGVQEVVQDCMDREKAQYLGDGLYSSFAHGLLTKDFSIFRKLILDALNSVFITPSLMSCFPCSFMQEHADYPLLAPMFCYMYYRVTGDAAFLKRIFPGLSAALGTFRESYAKENGLLSDIDKWCITEWPAPARDGYDVDLSQGKICKTMHNAINALYIGAWKFFNKIAGVIGESIHFDTSPLERSFCDAFFDEQSGLFCDSVISSHISLPGNAYALLFNLFPDRQSERRAVEFIRGKGISGISFYISFAILAGLTRINETGLCKSLLADEGAWLRMIREGATTTWEAWTKDGKWNTSLFHLAFTFPVHFLTDWDMNGIFDGI